MTGRHIQFDWVVRGILSLQPLTAECVSTWTVHGVAMPDATYTRQAIFGMSAGRSHV